MNNLERHQAMNEATQMLNSLNVAIAGNDLRGPVGPAIESGLNAVAEAIREGLSEIAGAIREDSDPPSLG